MRLHAGIALLVSTLLMLPLPAPAVVGVDWELASPLPQGNTLYDVTWSGSLFVAVGLLGSVVTSPDGISWTKRSSGTSVRLSAVTYGDGQFVAVGDAGLILSSSDGIRWFPRASGTNTDIADVVWGEGRFVAVGLPCIDSGCVAELITSPDAASWTGVGAVPIKCIALGYGDTRNDPGDGQFLCVGAKANQILTSPDGLVWTALDLSTPLAAAGGIKRVAFDVSNGAFEGFTGGQFGRGTQEVTSFNGTSWSLRRELRFGTPNAIASSRGIAVAVGSDGRIWINGDNPLGRVPAPEVRYGLFTALNSVVVGSDQFVAVGADGTILTSDSDFGRVWTLRAPGIRTDLRDITFGDGRFVAVGDRLRSFMSTDGRSWIIGGGGGRDFTALEGYFHVAWGGGTFVAVGFHDGSRIASTSIDGINWRGSLEDSGGVGPLVWNGAQFIMLGDSEILTSPDGVSWTLRFSATQPLADLTFGAGQVIAVGDAGLVVTSSDGVSWTEQTVDPNRSYGGIAFGAGTFVATGPGQTIVSSDGVSWTQTLPGVPVGRVFFANERFIATVGSDVMLSVDGRTWSGPRALAPPIVLQSVVGDGEQLISINGGFSVWRSLDAVDLSVVLIVFPDPVVAPDPLTYLMSVANRGLDPATGVRVVDELPPGLRPESATPSQGSCTLTGQEVSCDLGTIARDATVTVLIEAIPTRAGSFTNSVEVSSAEVDQNPANNVTSVTSTAQLRSADLAVAVIATPDPVLVGQQLSFSIDVTNAGPDVAGESELRMILPTAFLNFVSATPDQGSCIFASDEVSCALGAIASGGAAHIDVVVSALAAGNPGTLVLVEAVVNDPDSSNGFVFSNVEVLQTNDVSVTMTASPDPTLVGVDVSYDITVSNHGQTLVGDVVLVHTLPAGVTFVSASSLSCSESAGVITCNLLAFPATAVGFVRVVVTPTVAGPLHSTASVTTSDVDPDLANNTVVLDGSAIGLPRLSIRSATQKEGSGVNPEAIFSVDVSTPLGLDISVDYATVTDVATEDIDYVGSVGRLLIPAGEVQGEIVVALIADTLVETDEKFEVILSKASRAAIETALAIGTILDDDLQVNLDGPYAGIEGQSIVMSGRTSGGIGGLRHSWQFGDGEAGGGERVEHVYGQQGDYAVSLTVIDEGIREGSDTMQAAVADTAPSASFEVTRRDLSVGFTDTSSAYDGIMEWSWVFHEGPIGSFPTSTSPNPTYRFAAPGTYRVTLSVTDRDGSIAAAGQFVTVNDCSLLGGDLDGDGVCSDGDGSGFVGDGPCSCLATDPQSCREDCDDNCPWTANRLQLDLGGIGDLSGPDGLGDLCQCGDVDLDGFVGQSDVARYRNALADPVSLGLGFEAEEKCTVIGIGSDCDVLDTSVVRRNVEPPGGGLPPPIEPVCRAAVDAGAIEFMWAVNGSSPELACPPLSTVLVVSSAGPAAVREEAACEQGNLRSGNIAPGTYSLRVILADGVTDPLIEIGDVEIHPGEVTSLPRADFLVP